MREEEGGANQEAHGGVIIDDSGLSDVPVLRLRVLGRVRRDESPRIRQGSEQRAYFQKKMPTSVARGGRGLDAGFPCSSFAAGFARHHSMFEPACKNIDDVLSKDAGCTSELDYTEQTSWRLFLKYLDALEHDKATEAALDGKKYTDILDKPYRWEAWAAASTGSGQARRIDHNTAQTGDDLIAFINQKLVPYLQGFKAKAPARTPSNTRSVKSSAR